MVYKNQDGRIIDLAIRLLFLAALLYSALVMLVPLVSVVIWAGILSVAIYPVFDWLQKKLGGRKSFASVILVLLGLALTLGPVATGVSATVSLLSELSDKATTGQLKIPPAPEFILKVPLFGEKIGEIWLLFEQNFSFAVDTYGAQIKDISIILFGQAANIALSILGLALSAIFAGAFLSPGPRIVTNLQTFANRVFAPRGGEFVIMAGATIRNVTKGVIGVAALQALAIWVCLRLFGIPSAPVLAFVCFILSIVQIGPALVLLPLAIYAWNTMTGGAALLFTVLAVPLTIGDSFLRPVFIAKGLETPMIVIVIGVIGGVLAYGLLGIFMGPVLFAVFYDLFKMWMDAGSDDLKDRQGETS